MAVITKELLQKLETSIFKEASIRVDADARYFYLSAVASGPGPNLGIGQNIDIQYITDFLLSHPNKMISISIVDSYVEKAQGATSETIPIYIRLNNIPISETRYHFTVYAGFNNFSQGPIILSCGDFPNNRLSIGFGTLEYNNLLYQQNKNEPFNDAFQNGDYRYINIKFKIQTITLS